MKTKRVNRCGGLTLVEAMIVVAILSVLVAMMLPQLRRRKHCSGGVSCGNNLKQVGLSFRQWALDNNDKYPMQVSVTNGGAMEWARQGIAWPVFQVMSNELSTPKILFCPQETDTNRFVALHFGSPGSQGAFTNNQSLSYFAGLDADETQPQMLLSGDSNLEIGGGRVRSGLVTLLTNRLVGWSAARHAHQGNVALSDGSVRGFSNLQLRQALTNTGDAANRIIIP